MSSDDDITELEEDLVQGFIQRDRESGTKRKEIYEGVDLENGRIDRVLSRLNRIGEVYEPEEGKYRSTSPRSASGDGEIEGNGQDSSTKIEITEFGPEEAEELGLGDLHEEAENKEGVDIEDVDADGNYGFFNLNTCGEEYFTFGSYDKDADDFLIEIYFGYSDETGKYLVHVPEGALGVPMEDVEEAVDSSDRGYFFSADDQMDIVDEISCKHGPES
ncbi:MAG: hypothetical protein ABEJ72_08980 [Candidatus Aenigmatarchaeota archaeon]